MLSTEVLALVLQRRGKKVKSVRREGIGSYCEGWRQQAQVERKPHQTCRAQCVRGCWQDGKYRRCLEKGGAGHELWVGA